MRRRGGCVCKNLANEIERLFRRLKGSRRIFSGFEKLDVVFYRLYQFRSDR